MFESLPQVFRKHKLAADVRTLMQLRKSLERGLVNTLGDLYLVLKGLVTNSPKDYGPFTTAFYEYFLQIEIRPGESLDSAIHRSQAFADWKEKYLLDLPEGEEPDLNSLIDQFLNEVHLSTYDIQQFLKGEDVLNEDDPDQADTPSDGNQAPGDEEPRRIEEGVDYSNISLEELMERMRKVAEQQRDAHQGGKHWIGQGGASAYGNQGAGKGGIRVGGSGGGKMARKVIGDKNFYPVDIKTPLHDDNMDVALSFLKGIEEESPEIMLDIPKTIKEGVRQGGVFLPHIKEKVNKKVQVILLIDNGGWSMSSYIRMVTKLFSKMQRRFAHDLTTYYYHNTIYGGVYSDVMRTKFVSMSKLLSHSKDYNVFIIGDADMAPYELDRGSLNDWKALGEKYKKVAWMNPMALRFWNGSFTVSLLRKLFSMYPLSPEGIEMAVREMNGGAREWG